MLQGKAIVAPHSLQIRAILLANEDHQGVIKTKNLMRGKVWFTGIVRQVETMISGCIPCQAIKPSHTQEPVCMSEQSLSLFCGSFPFSDYILVVTDEYFRYPEVEIPHQSKPEFTKPDKIFSTLRTPLELKTDNGSPSIAQNM